MTDTDLSNPELAEVEVHGMNRASFILKGALATGAVYGASAVAPFVSTRWRPRATSTSSTSR